MYNYDLSQICASRQLNELETLVRLLIRRPLYGPLSSISCRTDSKDMSGIVYLFVFPIELF